jgi:hypothetical protein
MKPVPVAILAMALTLSAGAAMADVIDGDWCAPDGRHLSIRGPSITTPGGSEITGDYGRHSFTYVVPTAEPQAGATVFMRLLNEETVDVWVGSDVAAAEVWKRCTPISTLVTPRPPLG